jgi:hypothetical protein
VVISQLSVINTHLAEEASAIAAEGGCVPGMSVTYFYDLFPING